MTLLTSFLAATNYRSAFLCTLVPSVCLAYGIQAAVAIPSILAKNERFYDFSGSVTYLSCTALSLFLPAIHARSAAALTGAPKPAWPSLFSALTGKGGPLGFNWRQVALSAAVSIWAVRRRLLDPRLRIGTALTRVQLGLTCLPASLLMEKTRASKTSVAHRRSSLVLS
jgi:hypothetical protein